MSILILELIGLLSIHWIIILLIESFEVEHIPKEIKKNIYNKKIHTNIFRIQTYNSVMCGYFCIGFINFMLKDKSLTDFTNLFSPNDLKQNDDIILNYFKNGWVQSHWSTSYISKFKWSSTV